MGLVLALVSGMLVGLLGNTPALGNNVPVCSGLPSAGPVVKIGGLPALTVRGASADPCQTGQTPGDALTVTRTLLVSPGASAIASGNALLSATSVISNAGPTATNPWLLKLEPGLYDLGSQGLALPSYVDLEGSGEGTTVISSTIQATSQDNPADKATVRTASSNEIRFVTIQNSGGGTNRRTSLGVPAGMTNVSLYKVTLKTSGGNVAFGLYNAGIVTINQATIQAGQAGNTAGIENYSSATIKDSTITASSTYFAYALDTLSGSTTMVEGSTLSASVSSSLGKSVGINDSSSLVSANYSLINASGPGNIAFALYRQGSGDIRVTSSRLRSSYLTSGAGTSPTGTAQCYFTVKLTTGTEDIAGQANTDCT